MSARSPVSGRPGWLALVLSTVCWGSVVVTIKIAARGIPIQTITVIEVGATIAILAAVMSARGVRLRRPPVLLVIAGLLEPGLAYPLINAGLARTSGSHGAVIIGVESALIVLLDAILTRSLPSARVLVALAVTAIGAGVVGGGEGGDASLGGDALVAAGVLSAAAYVMAARRLPGNLDAVVLTFWQFAVGALVVVPVAAAAAAEGGHSWWEHPTGAQVLCAVLAGAIGSAGAFVLYNWALQRTGVAAAGVSLALIPVFGIGFAAALLGEQLTVVTGVAAASVIVGIALVATAPHPSTDVAKERGAGPA